METTIKSKYEVGNIVSADSIFYAKIVKIKVGIDHNKYYFSYLLEYEDDTRKWVSECNMYDIKERM